MTEKLQQTIKEELVKLSKEKREAINSVNWLSILEEIGKEYKLNESELNDLQSITLTVLVGLTDLDIYALDIEEELSTTRNDAGKIAKEVFEKIFTPITSAIEENIKKSGKDKNANPEQNLNFILSGGDYSAFVENPVPPLLVEEGIGGGNSEFKAPPRSDPSRSTPPSQGGEGNIKPPTLQEIKDKLSLKQ
jgi:hypothetical protein